MVRYVEACLLLLLAERPAHGHHLNERLPDVFPVPERMPDVSTIYRSLADLEGQGAVSFKWTAGDGGGRKVYELTVVGRDLLAFWTARFQEEQAGLVRFVEHFGRVVEGAEEAPNLPRRTSDTACRTAVGCVTAKGSNTRIGGT